MKEGTGTEKVHSLKGGEDWFIENHEGGVVCVRNGIEKIIELDLNDQERELLETSSKAVKNVMNVLDDLKVF